MNVETGNGTGYNQPFSSSSDPWGARDQWGRPKSHPDFGRDPTGGGWYETNRADESAINKNLSTLEEYYKSNFPSGRGPSDAEKQDAWRAWELGTPIDKFIESNVAPRLTNKSGGASNDNPQGSALQTAASIGAATSPIYRPFTFNKQTVAPYQAGTVSQFQQPAFVGTQQNLLQNVLSNPHTLNDQVVGGLKERYKEQALKGQQEMLQQLQQNAAGRGVLGGGWTNAQERKLSENTLSSILGSNRDIDIQQATQNRADELAALEAANAGAASAMGLYGTQLQGQLSQEELNRAAVESALQSAQFDVMQQQLEADELARAYGLGEGTRQFDLTFGEGRRQFDLGFGENQRQFNAGMGFNYFNANNAMNQFMLRLLLGGGF